ELRLSHMEHSLEDNRRFITSRVSRELQGLRQSLRQEFSNILQQQVPVAAAETSEQPTSVSSNRWGIGLLLLAGIIASLYFLLQIKTQLEQNSQQQDLLAEQLLELARQPQPLAMPTTTHITPVTDAA